MPSHVVPQPQAGAMAPDTLDAYTTLDAAAGAELDQLATLAAQICAAPAATISLRGDRLRWMHAPEGVPDDALLACEAFAHATLVADGQLVIPDTALDPGAAAHTMTQATPPVRFFAGTPVIGEAGELLGSLCVMDHRARELEPWQLEGLKTLARQVVATLELRRQSLELARNERMLRAVIESEPECVKLLGRDGSLLLMNRAGLTMIEADEFDQVAGACLYPLVHPQYRPDFEALTARVFAGDSGSMEFQITGLKGGDRWLETHATPLRSDTGEITSLLGITRDITAAKQATVALSESERRLRLALDAARMGTFDWDLDTNVVHRTGLDTGPWSYTVETGGGNSFDSLMSLVDPVDAPSLRDAVALAVSQGTHLDHEFRTMWPDGSVHWLAIHGEVTRQESDATHLLRGVVIEITERKAAEAALRESEARFRQLAENIQEVFWMTDPSKDVMVYISPAYETVWGRSRDSLYASPRDWLEAVHPEDRGRVAAASANDHGQGEFAETYRIVRPDGSIRWVHDRAYLVRDTDGKVVRIVGTAEDITARRQLEEQVFQSQKLEAVGQLAGGVAHDFNNLLTVIQGYASLMAVPGESAESVQEAAQQIVSAAERAANLTRQLLAFSRRQVLQSRRVDLNDIITSLAKMLQRLLGDGIEMRLQLHPRSLMTKADAGMLDQVLLNLIINARDAMPAGGAIVIETSERVLSEEEARSLAGAMPGRHACLRVTDTGVGISADDMARVFEPFFTTKPVGKGTGLGLATVFGIVSQHNGALSVRSEVGRGATFEVYLPLVPKGAEADVPSIPLARPMRNTETILLVEDDPAVRRLTQKVLERAGFLVLEAADGPDALHLWEQKGDDVDLLLTDLVMPGGMSGSELAAELRARNPALPVILTSGYSAEVAGRHVTLGNGQRFLEKPTSPAELVEAVRASLDGAVG